MSESLTTKELRAKSKDQLQRILAERREKLRHLRFQVSAKEVKNNQAVRYGRKEVARILTVLKESETQSNLIKP